ncbi:MAG: Acetylornithine/acetyl-lysine aminotransferase [Bacteroidetes bacterium ADurb.Bin217]|nr:MAG: Acetylornithine/acetyl-lysine aminotransferase [Bacteroidetes bacterium ADurb.Bin217]
MISQKQLFLQLLGQTSPNPLLIEVERAQGVYMYTPQGKQIIDVISGVSVSNLGHCHPRVVAAVQQQAQTYMHLMVYGELVQTPQVALAQIINSLLPEQLQSVYFVNSGSEAVEGALKLAKRVTGRSHIISTHNAYHGSTHGALSVMGNKDFTKSFEPLLPHVDFIHFNSIDDLKCITEQTACVIIEPIQSEAGIIEASKEFLQELRLQCSRTGTLLIFDEVQNGFGRTGPMFAFEHYGVIPDILCIAKGMGGGMPIGAFVSSKQHMDCFTHSPILGHITTFGGHPVSAAAAHACVSELIENTEILRDIESKSDLFVSLLQQHPKVKQIRGKGLFLAVELESNEQVHALIHRGLEHGVLLDFFLFCDTHFRIAPPLIITPDEIIESCKRICKALDEI